MNIIISLVVFQNIHTYRHNCHLQKAGSQVKQATVKYRVCEQGFHVIEYCSSYYVLQHEKENILIALKKVRK